MQDKKRQKEINDFLTDKCGLKKFRITPMSLDGSSRKYYRIELAKKQTRVLLDDKGCVNNSKEFALLSEFLRKNDIIAPKVFVKDLKKGLMLTEDFGNTDFVKKQTKKNTKKLLKKAVDILVKLHKAKNIPKFLGKLDKNVILFNFSLFADWFVPACLNRQLSTQEREDFFRIVESYIPLAQGIEDSIVLWDYHVNNVMFPEDYNGDAAVIDFQDAYAGCGLYDLASLLEDERSDFSYDLAEELKEYYFAKANPKKRDDFEKAYAFMALLRHMRVLGRFTTLIIFSHKPQYARYVPRALALFRRSLSNPLFKELKQWIDASFPEKYWTVPVDKKIDKAFVLAAGRGTRMRHLTEKEAKPMLKINGKRLIDYGFDLLRNAGIFDVTVNVCWQKESIIKHVSSVKGFNVTISEEKEALETGGGVKKAISFFGKDAFVVVNADNILIDDGYKPIICQMKDVWNSEKHDILLLLTHIDGVEGDTPDFGNYKVVGDKIFRNKQKLCNAGFDYGYDGVAIIHPRVFDSAFEGKFSLRDLFDVAESKGTLGFVLSDRKEFWVGSPEALEKTEKALAKA